MLVEVFRSARKAETYLYLPKGADQQTLPEALTSVFGRLEFVLGLDLQPERQLARYSGAEVLAAIDRDGFFLQMPDQDNPAEEDTAC
jgi:hypothetical protein